MRLFDIDRTNLRCQNHLIVIGNIITGRTQTIAVQNRSQKITIAEYDRSRTIPRLHHSCVITIEILDLLRHGFIMCPRSRNRHHHRQRKLHSAHHHELQSIIQHCGVGAFLIDDRQHLMHLRFKINGLHSLFPRHHLIYVAADRVNLTIMYDDTVRMCTHPARIGIGAEAGMHGCDRGLVVRILQIIKELTQFFDQEHTLIYNSTTAHGHHIGVVITLFKYASGNIQSAVKIQTLFHILRLADKALHDVRHFLYGLISDLFRMDRKISPAKELQSLFLYDDLQHFFCLISGKLILRKKEHTYAIFPFAAKFDSQRCRYLLKKFM